MKFLRRRVNRRIGLANLQLALQLTEVKRKRETSFDDKHCPICNNPGFVFACHSRCNNCGYTMPCDE
ncbi:hypothetical protein HQ587_01810 [bacterium]|nr:hypothetical protein [bacterium]